MTYVFLDYNRQKEGIVNEGKRISSKYGSFPIGSVMKLTDLSARQIRYYEDQELIKPDRNRRNRRMYSLMTWIACLKLKIISLKVSTFAAIKKNMLNVRRNPRNQ